MTRYKGHPVRGAIFGLLSGVFLAIDLMFLGAIATDSPLIIALPIAGFLVGLLLGLWAPLGRSDALVAAAGGSPFVEPPPQPFVEPPPGNPTPPPPAPPVVKPEPDAPSSGDDTAV